MSGLFLEFSEFPALRHVGDFTNWVGNLMESEAVCMCVCVHARVRTNSIRAGVFFFFSLPSQLLIVSYFVWSCNHCREEKT